MTPSHPNQSRRLSHDEPSRFYAAVLGLDLVTDAKVCGLSLLERARRVATRAGAAHVQLVRDAADLDAIAEWRRQHPHDDLLLLRASDQVVHTPLVDAVMPRRQPHGGAVDVPTLAVAPDDDAYAGAIWVPASRAAAAAADRSADRRSRWRRGRAGCA
jgi:hypothetical protein